MESESFHFFFYCLSFLLQTTFPFFQLSEQSSQRENEVHSCILKEAFKVEYSSNKEEGELRLAWLWLNVYNLAVQNLRMLMNWMELAMKHIHFTMQGLIGIH